MRTKISYLLLATFISLGAFAYTEPLPIREFPINIRQNITTSQQSNNISVNNADKNTYKPAIKELKQQINQNPTNYNLYPNLIDLYFKAEEYEKAYDELVFLINPSRKNLLDKTTLDKLNNLLQKYKTPLNDNKTKYIMYVDLALLAILQGDNFKAEEYISAASESFSNPDIMRNAISIVFDNTKNVQKALVVCNRALVRNPNDIELRRMKASYLVQLKNYQAAEAEYSKILTIKKDDSEALYYLYKSLSSQNIPEKEIIKRIYNSENPNYEKAYYGIADMLLKKNETSAALKFAETLVNKYPDCAEGYMLLSEIYKKEGKLQECYDALQKLRDKADSNEAIAKYNVTLAKLSDQPVKEANSLIETGLYQQAIDVLDSSNPDALYVILTKSRAYYLLGKKTNTFDLLNQAMILYPENSDVYCAFGYIYLKEKDIETARKYVNRSLQINPKNSTALDLLDMVNQAETDTMISGIISAYEAQNYPEAMSMINEALNINSKDPELYYYKGLIYIAKNNYAAATSVLYKSIELDKNHMLSYFYLGLAFDNLSEKATALENYKKFINLLPKDAFEDSEKRDYALARIKKLEQN